MLYALKNLTELAVTECPAPEDFKPVAPISAQIRGNKEDRQNWYMDPTTVHQFYSYFEGINKNQRISKDSNPPFGTWGVCADYDTKISDARIDEAIAAMDIKPMLVEKSLGVGTRLHWRFERIVHLGGNYDFSVIFQKNLKAWLSLDQLPQLDEAALCAPSRMYANGGEWRKVPGGLFVPERKFQAYLVKCGQEFQFISGDAKLVPMDLVEKALREKFGANFDWPGNFEEGAQGPTFWIPESKSPMSAIIKEGGIFTFSAHADKPFYSWGDLLGKEFIKDFMESSISKATAGWHWDGKVFWRRAEEGRFVTEDQTGLDLHLQVACKMSGKPDSSGVAPTKQAAQHIRTVGRVEGAGHYVFHPPGLILIRGAKYINLYNKKCVQPSGPCDMARWGEKGGFPFRSKHLDWLFDPNSEEQLAHYLSWCKVFYESALYNRPCAGQNYVFKGGRGVGKTFENREGIGHIVGGSIDASSLIVDGSSFNGTFFEYPHWALDDDSALIGGRRSVNAVYAQLKKFSANDDFTSNQKYMKAAPVKWAGRIGLTVNPDMTSAHMVSADTDLDKLNMYSCRNEKGDFKFPNRADMLGIRDREMPYFCQFLLEWKIPEHWLDPERWGVLDYQEASMLSTAKQGSPSATFKEVLVGALSEYFRQVSDKSEWTGPVTELQRLILAVPGNTEILRGLKVEQTNRHLEQIYNEGCLRMKYGTGDRNIRLWTFHRESFVKPTPATPTPEMGEGNFNAPTHNDCAE